MWINRNLFIALAIAISPSVYAAEYWTADK